jgi:hypothetical protein
MRRMMMRMRDLSFIGRPPGINGEKMPNYSGAFLGYIARLKE